MATTTRTRVSRDNGVEVTRAFRVTPAGLADGLELGSVPRRDRRYAPVDRVPRALRVAQRLGPNREYTPIHFLRRRTCTRIGPTEISSSIGLRQAPSFVRFTQ